MSRKWRFKESPDTVIRALLSDVEDLQDLVAVLGAKVQELDERAADDAAFAATHTHHSYMSRVPDGLGDIGPVL